jgi:hypothetical protein
MMQFCETRECRRRPLLAYFGETHTCSCGYCDNCGQSPAKHNAFQARATPRMSGPSKPILRPMVRRKFHKVGELFCAGQSVPQLARHFDVKTKTIVENLYRFHQSGGALVPERVLASSRLSEYERTRVLNLFKRLGCKFLSPVYIALSGSVTYEELHVLRLYFLCCKPR